MTELEEALDPQTTPARLTELSAHPQKEVVSAIAANPGAPLEVLLRVAHRFPAQFLQNPLLPLLFLEQPDFFQSIPVVALCAILQKATPPEWLLEAATKHPHYSVREAAAKSPLATPAMLRALSRDYIEAVIAAIAEHPGTPADVLAEIATAKSFRLRMKIAKNPRAPEAALLTLCSDRNDRVRSAVVQNPQTTLAMILVFAQETARDVLCAVAQHPLTPPEVLERLSREQNPNVRVAIAKNLTAPAELLSRLASDPNGDIRRAVAQNPETPSDLLLQLKRDKNEDIRTAARRRLQERASVGDERGPLA